MGFEYGSSDANYDSDDQAHEYPEQGYEEAGEFDPTSGIVPEEEAVDPADAEIILSYAAGVEVGQTQARVEGVVPPTPPREAVEVLRTLLSGKVPGAETASVGELAAFLGMLHGANPQPLKPEETPKNAPQDTPE